MPAGRFEIEYEPVEADFAVTVRLVAVLRAATVTSGTADPEASDTVPVIVPKICCARDGKQAASASARIAAAICELRRSVI
jgi:hypothetical protein